MYKKKGFIVLLLVVCVVALANCEAPRITSQIISNSSSSAPQASDSKSENASASTVSASSRDEESSDLSSSDPLSGKKSYPATYQTDVGGIFPLGQDSTDFEKVLKANSIGFSGGKDNTNEDGGFGYQTDDLYVWFDLNGKELSIAVYSTYETREGVRIGDPFEKMISAYGDKYNSIEGLNTYEYTDGKVYLTFFYDDQKKIREWSLATESIEELMYMGG